MALKTLQVLSTAGTKPTFTAAAASDTFPSVSGHNCFVVYRNAHATDTRTLTVVVPGNLETGDAYPDKAYTAPALGEVWIPLLPVEVVTSTGLVTITASNSAADLTLAYVRVP